MRAFYIDDRRVMRWVREWVYRGSWHAGRPELAAQLRLLRKHYGNSVAAWFRNHLLWVGSYPVKRGMR